MQSFASETEQSGNAILGVAGALGGAALGGAVYYGIMAASNYQIGYIACLVGVASGYGSLLIGRSPSLANGFFCAVFSLGAILGAEYLYYQRATSASFTVESYRAGPDREDYDSDAEYAEAVAAHKEFMALSRDEQEEYVKASIAANFSFRDYLTMSTYNLIILGLFGFLGISYGYKIGVGRIQIGGRSSSAVSESGPAS